MSAKFMINSTIILHSLRIQIIDSTISLHIFLFIVDPAAHDSVDPAAHDSMDFTIDSSIQISLSHCDPNISSNDSVTTCGLCEVLKSAFCIFNQSTSELPVAQFLSFEALISVFDDFDDICGVCLLV
jgi:hypothetical protein